MFFSFLINWQCNSFACYMLFGQGHFLYLKIYFGEIFPSMHLPVAHHISGNIHHVIIVFGTLGGRGRWGVKGKKITQNYKKFCLSCSNIVETGLWVIRFRFLLENVTSRAWACFFRSEFIKLENAYIYLLYLIFWLKLFIHQNFEIKIF